MMLTIEQENAFDVVIEILDNMMIEKPNRELADASNILEEIKRGTYHAAS